MISLLILGIICAVRESQLKTTFAPYQSSTNQGSFASAAVIFNFLLLKHKNLDLSLIIFLVFWSLIVSYIRSNEINYYLNVKLYNFIISNKGRRCLLFDKSY